MHLKYPKPEGYDVELALETKVLGLKLHYGLWRDDEELSLENLKKAQERYTEHLLTFIPKGVKQILDVGCGIGDNAIALAKEGYEILSISPDPAQKKVFTEITKEFKNIHFFQSKFEDFKTEQKFDLILMSESSNYFNLEVAMNHVSKYLKPDGFFLVSGLFRKKNTSQYNGMHIENNFVKSAESHGLTIVKSEDITSKVVPTLELGNKFLIQYVNPTIEVISTFYSKAFRWKIMLINLFFRKEIRLFKETFLEYIPERLDYNMFSKLVTYKIYLFSY